MKLLEELKTLEEDLKDKGLIAEGVRQLEETSQEEHIENVQSWIQRKLGRDFAKGRWKLVQSKTKPGLIVFEGRVSEGDQEYGVGIEFEF